MCSSRARVSTAGTKLEKYVMEPDRLWHIELDAAICDGHGICALRCPDRIGLDEWGYAVVDTDAITDERLLRRARRAVAACPEHALTLRAHRGAASLPQKPTAMRRSAR